MSTGQIQNPRWQLLIITHNKTLKTTLKTKNIKMNNTP